MTKKIPIKGDVVDNATAMLYEYFKMDCVSPKALNDALAEGDEDIELSVASNGGDVFAASEIYTALKNYPGKITVNIEGLAASAASVIAMAGDTIRISPTAQMMIHKAWSQSQGNADDLGHEAGVLQSIDDSISMAYQQKTKLSDDEIQGLMRNETWMGAKEAVDRGFADEIMFVDESQPVIINSISEVPSKNAVNKFLNLIKNEKKQSQPEVKKHATLFDHKLAILMQEKENFDE
ncbi:Clp protease ClpP [Pediococcus stilesii]|uniref:ATP-dependent Clp protease proteolytic subunit n=1 Tax=Pediococcus stilesii TaxID=331679 RepID=A0A5R9BTS7_9LACO|nr:head maturation protease, ClpP-related [Pediococcus stilesii]TLQ03643.1 Clp protease ClpP [Pediococcus stilesii]